jgi:hypothetical protein
VVRVVAARAGVVGAEEEEAPARPTAVGVAKVRGAAVRAAVRHRLSRIPNTPAHRVRAVRRTISTTIFRSNGRQRGLDRTPGRARRGPYLVDIFR